MSAVTLETLRADFDAEFNLYEAKASQGRWPSLGASGDDLLGHIADEKPDPFNFTQSQSAMIRTGVFYVIARDHGLQAAMLYKLSDGAMDPRGAA